MKLKGFRIIPYGALLCPLCGGTTHSRGYLKRHVKDDWGDNSIWEVQQRQCDICKSKHTVLPDFIEPYKQYI